MKRGGAKFNVWNGQFLEVSMDHEVTWSLSDHEKEKVEDSLGEKKKLPSHVQWSQLLQVYGQ